MATPEPAEAGTGVRVSLEATRVPYRSSPQIATAEALARQLGARRAGGGWLAACPVCQPERRRDQAALSICDGDGGRLLAQCFKTGCNFRDIIAALEMEPQHCEAAAPLRAARQPVNLSAWKLLWNAARPAAGGPVAGYLLRRGLLWPAGALVRWAPSTAAAVGLGGHGAMLVRALAPDGRFRGLQATAIGPDGERLLEHCGKTWRRSHGALRGAAAWLVPGNSPVIAEGTESALAALELATAAALAAMPPPDDDAPEAAWVAYADWHATHGPSGAVSTMGTAGMGALELPLRWQGQAMRRALVAADNDAAGHKAAAGLVALLQAAGIPVEIIRARADEADLADTWTEHARGHG